MAQYVFACIVSEQKGVYTASFPNIDVSEIHANSLYQVIELAYSLLLTEAFIKEESNEAFSKMPKLNNIELKEKQYLTLITCDTNSLSTILDLYDDVRATDIIEFLKEKDKEAFNPNIKRENSQAAPDNSIENKTNSHIEKFEASVLAENEPEAKIPEPASPEIPDDIEIAGFFDEIISSEENISQHEIVNKDDIRKIKQKKAEEQSDVRMQQVELARQRRLYYQNQKKKKTSF